MAKLRALIVGVSDYSLRGGKDLAFCKNDIYAIKDAFVHGLKMEPSDAIVCGESGIVKSSDFISALHELVSVAEEDDTLLLYFSGHGKTLSNVHYLVFSDKIIATQEIIEHLGKIQSKNKVLFLDCCLAGNFAVGETAVFDVNETADEFAGRGYAVFASCNSQQNSYGHPDKPISLFTSFLCEALTNKFIIREGKKSLNDIHKLLFMLLDSWNKNNLSRIQTPIYRANMGGTIYFHVQDYHPYAVETFFAEQDCYIVYSVTPLHNAIAKRYSVQIIL